MRALLTLVTVAVIAGAAPVLAGPKKIVCWNDETGKKMCGDSIPPQYAKTERQVYDDKGRVVERLAREKTPEEIEAEKQLEKIAKEAAVRKTKQDQYDKFLLQAYEKPADIEKVRDERLGTLDYRIRLTQKSLADGETSLKAADAQSEKLKAEGKEPDARLKKQLRDLTRVQGENTKALATMQAEREEATRNFERDINRFNELRAQQATTKEGG